MSGNFGNYGILGNSGNFVNSHGSNILPPNTQVSYFPQSGSSHFSPNSGHSPQFPSQWNQGNTVPNYLR